MSRYMILVIAALNEQKQSNSGKIINIIIVKPWYNNKNSLCQTMIIAINRNGQNMILVENQHISGFDQIKKNINFDKWNII